MNDPELWFETSKQSVAMAKKICSTCIYRDTCLEDCLEYESMSGSMRFGIFGGLTPRERNHLRAKSA